MRIRAYIRLQRCTTNTRSAFVARRWPNHGIAAGTISYYAVEGSSWTHIRRVLKTFEVMGASGVSPKCVQAWTVDCGEAVGGLWRLTLREIPAAALFSPDMDKNDNKPAPELTSFGAGAIAIERGMEVYGG